MELCKGELNRAPTVNFFAHIAELSYLVISFVRPEAVLVDLVRGVEGRRSPEDEVDCAAKKGRPFRRQRRTVLLPLSVVLAVRVPSSVLMNLFVMKRPLWVIFVIEFLLVPGIGRVVGGVRTLISKRGLAELRYRYW